MTSKQKLEALLSTPDYKSYLKERSLMVDLAVQFKLRREAAGLSQAQLAKKMGVYQPDIVRMESGDVSINTATIEKFCDAMNVRLVLEDTRLLIKETGLSKAIDVAKFIVETVQKELKDHYDVSHLKLQKLLYYVQLYYLGRYFSPMVSHKFEAWEHGPVYPEIYSDLKKCGSQTIFPEDIQGDSSALSKKEKELIEEVMLTYAKLSAWQLCYKTHAEMPWKNAWEKGKSTPISMEDMKIFYGVSMIPNIL